MRRKMTLTEGQLRQIVEDASRMVIKEMLDDGFFFRGMNDRRPRNSGGLTGSMDRMTRNAGKNALNFMPNASASKPSALLNFMPNASASKPSALLNFLPGNSSHKPNNLLNYFMPNDYAYNGFNGMAYNYGPGMYFPNGFYPGYQG